MSYQQQSFRLSLFALIIVIGAARLYSQGLVPSGQVQGEIFSQQGNNPIAKATVVLQQEGTTAGTPLRASTLSAADGSFNFTGVPAGTFTICIQVPGSIYLDPCTWSDKPPTVAVTARLGASVGKIRLDEGQLLKVNLNDTSRVLQADEGRVAGAKVLVGVWTPIGLFVPMAIRTKNTASRDLELPIPVGKLLQISVSSSYYDLTDESNTKVNPKGISLPVQASPNAALHVYTFNITGRKSRQ